MPTSIKNKLIVLLLLPGALIVIIPMWLVITGMFMDAAEAAQHFAPVLSSTSGWADWPVFPQYPTLEPLVSLLLDTPAFFVMFWNTVKIVVPVLVGQVAVGAPAAWALARYKFRGRQALYLLYIALMLMPFQVTMVPSYLTINRLGMMNTHWSIILPGIFSTFPVFIMVRFFGSIPEDTLESAALDGAGSIRVFFYIGLPLGAPGILSAVVLGFIEYWNTIEQPLIFLKEKSLWPLSLWLPSAGLETLGISLVASVIMLTPAILIFLFGQRYLEQGIHTAGLKE